MHISQQCLSGKHREALVPLKRRVILPPFLRTIPPHCRHSNTISWDSLPFACWPGRWQHPQTLECCLLRCRRPCWRLRAPHAQRSGGARASAQRTPKDPRKYTMDEMREILDRPGDRGPGFLAGVLNWLSGSAFGESRQAHRHGTATTPLLGGHRASSLRCCCGGRSLGFKI